MENLIFTILFLACAIYAVILEGFKNKYIPDGLIFTVMVGDGLVWLALATLERSGVALTAWLVLKALLVGGTPIALWQAWQFATRRKERGDGT